MRFWSCEITSLEFPSFEESCRDSLDGFVNNCGLIVFMEPLQAYCGTSEGDTSGQRDWAVLTDLTKKEGASICVLKKVEEFLESGLTGMEVWLQSSPRR